MDTDSSPPLLNDSLVDGWQSDQPLSNCILMLFEYQILTDVTFHCKDQDIEDPAERIHAHKNILAARSPVFRAMFSGSYKDGEREIHLTDIESKDFKVFLRSIYSDKLPTEVDTLVQTLTIAHKYQINYIVDRCFSKLSERLTIENACSLLDLAIFYENEELTTVACRYIDANSKDILESEGFLKVSLQCLTFILKGDTFFTDETQVFERSLQWAEKRCNSSDVKNLRNTLGEAFFYLRTPAMTLKEFMSCTKRKGYYTLQETEDIMEAIAKKDDEKYDHELCNSRTSRIPPQIYVDTQIKDKHCSSTHVPCATAQLTLTPKIDILLTEIMFSDLHKGGIRNQGFSRSSDEYDTSGRQLKATVTIKNIDIFQEYTLTVQRTPLRIGLKKPILLQSSKDEYCLKIELKPTNLSCFELKVQTIETGVFADDFGKLTIRCDSTCHAIVKGLTFHHLSHRKD